MSTMSVTGPIGEKIHRIYSQLQARDIADKDIRRDNLNEIIDCQMKLTVAHCQIGDYLTALHYVEECLTTSLERDAENEPHLADVFCMKGEILVKLWLYSDAMQSLTVALEKYELVYGRGSDSIYVARTYSIIGDVHRRKCEYVLAKQYHKEAVEMAGRVTAGKFINPGSREINYLAAIYTSIGDCHADSCELHDALLAYEKADTLYTKNLVDENLILDFIDLQCSMSKVWIQMSRYKHAFNVLSIAESFLTSTIDQQAHTARIKLNNAYGHANIAIDNYTAAFASYNQAFQTCLSFFMDNTRSVLYAQTLSNMGDVYSKRCNLDEALSLYISALHIGEKLADEDDIHPQLAASHNLLGNFLRDKAGQFSKALTHHSKALVIFQNFYGNGCIHKDIADTYECIGRVYADIEGYARARECFDKSVDMNFKLRNESMLNIDIIHNYINIGNLLVKEGKAAVAVEYYEEAVHAIKTVYYDHNSISFFQHKTLAEVYNLLGVALYKSGDEELSQLKLKEAESMSQGLFPFTLQVTSHPIAIESILNLGDLYANRGCYRQALDYYYNYLTKCISFVSSTSSQNNLSVVEAHLKVGLANHKVGKFRKTHDHCHVATTIANEVLKNISSVHPIYADIASLLAISAQFLGDYKKAIGFHSKVLDIYVEIYREHPNNKRKADSLYNMAGMHYQLGLYDKSVQYYRECADVRTKMTEENKLTLYVSIAEAYEGAGRACIQMMRYDLALDYLKKSLELKQDAHHRDHNHHDLAKTYTLYGELHSAQQDHTLALQYYQKALDIQMKLYGENFSRRQIGKCYDNIGLALSRQGEWEGAFDALNMALDYKEKAKKFAYHIKFDTLNINEVQPKDNFEKKYVKDIESEIANAHYPSICLSMCYHGNVHLQNAIRLYNEKIHGSEPRYELHDALDYYKNALRLTEDFYPSSINHPMVATILYNSAFVKQQKLIQGIDKVGYKEALKNHNNVLKMRENVYELNTNHPDIATSYNSIGYMYYLMGDPIAAKKSCSIALDKLKAFFGNNAPSLESSIVSADLHRHPVISASY